MCDYNDEPYISIPKAALNHLPAGYGRVENLEPMEFSDEFIIQFQNDFGQEIENINIIASTLCAERPPWRLLYLTMWLHEILDGCWYRVSHEVSRN